MASLIQECINRPLDLDPVVCLTGQHRELLAPIVQWFNITADDDLGLMTPDQTLAELTARCLTGIDSMIQKHHPDCVLAQGDTTTVMVAALAAFYRRIPFVHIEAGLRTGTLSSPWPEELNRRIATIASNLHCAPTTRAADALFAEGVSPDRVRVTGNTVIDALMSTVARLRVEGHIWQHKHAILGDRKMILITGHRRENFGTGFRNICTAISTLARQFEEIAFLYPVHLNPNVRRPVHEVLGNVPNVYLVEPADYPEFVWLMTRSHIILTDSGGVQEEAPSLRKPVLIMRDTTERPEAVELGGALLVGTTVESIVSEVTQLLHDTSRYATCQLDHNPYGDGQSASRIIEWILEQPWRGRQQL
jgi:UDP-N-acetylglucosamine 2-epimerase